MNCVTEEARLPDPGAPLLEVDSTACQCETEAEPDGLYLWLSNGFSSTSIPVQPAAGNEQ